MRLTLPGPETCWKELQLLAATVVRFPKAEGLAERQARARFVSRSAQVLARLWGEQGPALVATAVDDVFLRARSAA